MKTKTTNYYSSEIRERAVRMVREHQGEYTSEWAAIRSIAGKIGCTAETRLLDHIAYRRHGLETAGNFKLLAIW